MCLVNRVKSTGLKSELGHFIVRSKQAALIPLLTDPDFPPSLTLNGNPQLAGSRHMSPKKKTNDRVSEKNHTRQTFCQMNLL